VVQFFNTSVAATELEPAIAKIQVKEGDRGKIAVIAIKTGAFELADETTIATR
jgi:hypothetical protein